MNNTINILKLSNDPNLAHVYEHLVAFGLRKKLQDMGLFNYIDFDISGQTYDNYMSIEVIHFTDRGKKVVKEVIDQKILPSKDQVLNAVYELFTEHGHRLTGDIDEIYAGVKQLDGMDWIYLNTTSDLKINSGDIKETLELTSIEVPIREIKVILSADQNFSAPLFHIIASTIQNNLLPYFASDYQYYFRGFQTKYSGKTLRNEYIYDAWSDHRAELTTEVKMCKEKISGFMKNGLSDATYNFLKDVDYAKQNGGPSYQEVIEATGLLIGASGWHELADKERIDEILRSVKFDIIY